MRTLGAGTVAVLMAALAACAHSGARAPRVDDAQAQPVAVKGCSGVPSDPSTPAGFVRAGAATHGPGAPGAPMRMALRWPPDGLDYLPPLYVFDPDAGLIHRFDGRDRQAGDIPLEWMQEAEFVAAEDDAYWGEVVDRSYFRIPWLGPCQLAELLPPPAELAAPPRGLLFLQFVSPRCRDCARLSRAIQRTLARHPQRPMRWVQVETDQAVGGR